MMGLGKGMKRWTPFKDGNFWYLSLISRVQSVWWCQKLFIVTVAPRLFGDMIQFDYIILFK